MKALAAYIEATDGTDNTHSARTMEGGGRGPAQGDVVGLLLLLFLPLFGFVVIVVVGGGNGIFAFFTLGVYPPAMLAP